MTYSPLLVPSAIRGRPLWGLPADGPATRSHWGCAPPLRSGARPSDPQVASRRFLGGLGQRLDGLALLRRELLRHRHLGCDEQVTGTLADRHAAALDAERAPRTCAR